MSIRDPQFIAGMNESGKKAMKKVVESGRCPYVFPEHGTHASQQCTLPPHQYGHHNCGGIKKGDVS